MKRYIIIAGETSGDNFGGQLIKSIRESNQSNVEFWGTGGTKMIQEGLNVLDNINKISVVGFSEVIRKVPYMFRLRNRLSKFINELQPSNLILIDFPGFNLSLLKRINNEINVTYFISPQIWAWNPGRIKLIKKYVDRMLVIFPFEESYYNKRNVDVHYIGHPFLDTKKYKELIANSKKKNKKGLIGVFPGSREEELKRHLPIYIRSISKFCSENKNYEFAIGLAPNFSKETIREKYNIDENVKIIDKKPLDMLAKCDAAIVTSGTISLEATFLNVPCVVAYKLSFFSWLVSKLLIKSKFISITNIMADKEIIPELLQKRVNEKMILKKVEHVIKNDKKIQKNLLQIKKQFQNKSNAIENATQLILNNDTKN